MIVYLLIIIGVTALPTKIDIDTIVFKDSAKCLRNATHFKKALKQKYDQVNVECVERKLKE